MDKTIETRKTYHGKTAGGILKTASVSKSQAGLPEIWVKLDGCDGYIAQLTDSDDLAIHSCYGLVALLETSATAARKLRQLNAKRDEMIEATL